MLADNKNRSHTSLDPDSEQFLFFKFPPESPGMF